MIGGNQSYPNIPVEYHIKYPCSLDRDAPDRINTFTLAQIIDDHGPENVLFLAQSIKSAGSPIRVHVNKLLKIKDEVTGPQKYNFHVKEKFVDLMEGTT